MKVMAGARYRTDCQIPTVDNRFDGDELNVGLILDEAMWEKVKRLQPHTGVLDLNKPRSVSNNLKLPTPILSMIGNWLHSPGK